MLQVFVFSGNDVLLNLVQQYQLLFKIQQLIDGEGVGTERLEMLDLGPEGH